MTKSQPRLSSDLAPDAALDRALRRVLREIHDGLRHGFFEFTLTCEVVSSGKRRLLLRAGKHYQFLIEAHECDTGTSLGSPHDEGANESTD